MLKFWIHTYQAGGYTKYIRVNMECVNNPFKIESMGFIQQSLKPGTCLRLIRELLCLGVTEYKTSNFYFERVWLPCLKSFCARLWHKVG